VYSTSVLLQVDQPPQVGSRINAFSIEIMTNKASYCRVERFGKVEEEAQIFNITGLNPGTSYTFRSRAENQVGPGIYSDWTHEIELPLKDTIAIGDEGRAAALGAIKPAGLTEIEKESSGAAELLGSTVRAPSKRGLKHAGTVQNAKVAGVYVAQEKDEEDEEYDAFEEPAGNESLRIGIDLPGPKGKFSARKPVKQSPGADLI
jgi:hypothetical protein